MVDHLLALFPRLRPGAFRVTSPRDRDYNCVAWAVGVTDDWWWPLRREGRSYWPAEAPRQETQAAFQVAFATLGFVPCPGEEPEPGFEKIALFADHQGTPTHAARQLPGGRWTSKLGQGEDIEHDLHDLEGDIYGTVALVFRRRFPGTAGAFPKA